MGDERTNIDQGYTQLKNFSLNKDKRRNDQKGKTLSITFDILIQPKVIFSKGS